MSIACPTCKLINDEDELNCRRCFTPLVVTLRSGSASGSSKGYSRRFIDYASQSGRLSWLRVVAGCLLLVIVGFILQRAALRLGKEPPRLVVSQPQVARFLRANVRYQDNRLIVTNNDSFDWKLVELVINPAKPETPGQPCCWQFVLPLLNTNETVALELSSFRNKNGQPFNTDLVKLEQLQLNCYVGESLHQTAVSFP
ncbi:MAG: hypothetical protein AB1489_19380 [Acidobacteriota bacterium]